MKKLLAALLNRWVIAALGLVALALVIWFLGPLLGFGDSRPLTSPTVRIIVILALALAWLVYELIKVLRSQRASRELADGIARQEATVRTPDAQGGEEVGRLRAQFDEALGLLRKTRGERGRVNLYELPWYVIVGPPGSGKTTALVNSGLQFPLAERFGNRALRGIGGTRNCDWWFTDDAILLDTAGRYVTQDSDVSADSAEWQSFLDLLKKHRRRRPINGVLVSVSISDVLQMAPQERGHQVSAIRQRIQELYQRLGIRVPIYVVITKCDLLAGFVEFFEDLSREQREQVWGMTFDLSDEGPARFDAEFDRLIGRLNERVIERVDHDRDLTRRSLIYDFPAQLANVKPLLSSFLDEVFRGSRYEVAPLVRGVYFTSGTQEGSPIDRLMGTVSRNFGINIEALPAFRGEGRSYFVTRLFKDVIFREAELAGTDRRLERRLALARAGVAAGALVVAGLAMFGWAVSYFNNGSLIEATGEAVAQSAEALARVTPATADIEHLLPALNQVRGLPGGYASLEASVPLTMGLGLYQGEKLGGQALLTYRRLLIEQFLPLLMTDLEDQLRRGGDSTDYRYEALKRYLMLDSRGHYDAAAIVGWFRAVWTADYARHLTAAQLADLHGHVDALFETRPEPLPIALDDELIARTRADLLRIPLEERAYARIKRAPTSDLPGFSIASAAGEEAAIVFVRKSGRALRDTTPAMFTRDGYQNIFLPESARVSTRLLEESWVLGNDAGAVADMAVVTERVRDLYFEDYVRTYEELLLDLELAPFGSPQAASRILRILSSEDSPLQKLVAAVKAETQLEDAGAAAAAGRLAEGVAEQQQELTAVLGRTSAGAAVNRAAQRLSLVQNRFRGLQDLVGDDGAGPLDRILEILRELYEFMSLVVRQGDALPPHVAEGGEASISRLEAESAGKPPFLENMMTSAASQTSRVAFGGVSNYLNEEWRTKGAGFCRDAIAGRYPISRGSEREIQLQDFAEFFGPGGIMQGFFDTYLTDYVDTSGNPWRVKESRSGAFNLNEDALRQFERARRIREVFFKGDMGPAVSFELTPIRMDPALSEFSLELGGKRILYRSGPRFPELMDWPGAQGSSLVRIQMAPAGPSGQSTLEARGPWAWFRVLDQASIRAADEPEKFRVDFSIEGRVASYELAARSAYNPFALQELSQFQCPRSL
jgi:type VI secretion system protein ImpL